MRKDLLALGLILSLVGLIFMSLSQAVVKPEPLQSWTTVAESTSLQPHPYLEVMSVNETFESGDRIKVIFEVRPHSGGGPMLEGAGVLVNLTDPSGYTKSFDRPLVLEEGMVVGLTEPFPEVTANHTGTYRADAYAIFVSLRSLAFQKMKIEETNPQYPYSVFLPVGGVIFVGGNGTLLLGAKISKRRRRGRKHKR